MGLFDFQKSPEKANRQLLQTVAKDRLTLYGEVKGEQLDPVEVAWLTGGALGAMLAATHIPDERMDARTATELLGQFVQPVVSWWYWRADARVERSTDERAEARVTAFTNMLVAFGDYGPGVAAPVSQFQEKLEDALAMDLQFGAEMESEEGRKTMVYHLLLTEKVMSIFEGTPLPLLGNLGLPLSSTLDLLERREELGPPMIATEFEDGIAVRGAMAKSFQEATAALADFTSST